jgi:hypothetical protein
VTSLPSPDISEGRSRKEERDLALGMAATDIEGVEKSVIGNPRAKQWQMPTSNGKANNGHIARRDGGDIECAGR